MAKKKRLRQLAAKTSGDDLVQIDFEQSELTTNSNNNDKNTVSTCKGVNEVSDSNANTVESSKIFGSDQLLKTEAASTSLVPEKVSANGNTPVDKPARPRSRQDSLLSETRTPPKNASGKQRRLKKETVRNKMEQKMNMRMKNIKDPRLIPRMKEYLECRVNKNFVSIPLMADYLQQKYAEYGRKKKSMFVQYVDKAYSYMEKPCNNDPPPPLSDTDEESNTEKELVEQDGRYVWKNVSEHSRERGEDTAEDKGEDTMGKDNNASSDNESLSNADLENLVEYKDTNSINNRLMNMYRDSPKHVSNSNQDEKKRKLSEATPSKPKRSKSDSKVLYASPNVLERNMSSTGLVGPRRSSSDKYFIDRKGDEASKKTVAFTEFKDSRESTIQKFLGNLPSRTSFSSYVSGGKDPRLKGGTLYRVFTGKTEEELELLHSGITEENVGTTDVAPRSPSTVGQDESETPDEVDPRMRNDDMDGKSGQSVKKSFSSNKDKQMKSKKKQIPKQKKGSSSSRNQDMSETETENGPAIQKSSTTFADVGGNEKTLIEICKLLVHMRHPEVYCQLGVTPPRGFLLHGPPGCGKTLLANAIAGELDLPLMKIAATEIVSGVSGDSEDKIRGLFDKASQNAPCVVFIDEIDSITPKRETASKDMERRIVAQLLACMDDLNANPGCHVLVIGATNRPDSLDPALRRAGRFDKEICLGIPDETSRLRILEVLCRNLRLSSEFDFKYLAHNTPGYVGADLMALTREAAMTAVNRVFQSLQSKTNEELMDKSVDSNLCDDPRESSANKQASDKTLTQSLPGTNSSTKLTNNCSPFLIPLSKVSLSPTKSVKSSNVGQESIDKNMSASNGDCNSSSADNLLTWTSKTETSSVDKEVDNGVVAEANMCKNDSSKSDRTEDQNTYDVEKDVQTDKDLLQNESSDDKSVANKSNTENVVSMETNDNSSFNGKLVEIDTIVTTETPTGDVSMEINNVCDEPKNVSDNEMTNSQKTKTYVQSSEYMSVLKWLKEHPPLSETQLKDLYIIMEDFKEALTTVQPSAKREGFATVPDVTWEHIGALQDVREELQLAILAPVRHPEQFKSLGLNRAQGVMLAGPPGCGKTLLAKAVANESGINFISVKGPELLNMYVGESERAVRTVFQRARNSAPCVIFFDELDALCPRRSGNSEGNSSARVVNQLLTEMDGLEDRKQVFIMAATNRPDIIDPAVLRPGRLDKTLYVGLPTPADRLDILKCLTKDGKKPLLGKDVDMTQIAEDVRANCLTGADLAALVREASIAALKEVIMSKTGKSDGPVVVTGDHFNQAFNKVKPSVSAKDQEKYSSMRNRLDIV